LAGWKVGLLSMAGHLTLINSVNSSIPVHQMQVLKFLTKIMNKLDHINRNFLWGSAYVKKGIHIVNWNDVTDPEVEGGLGIKVYKLVINSMLAKLSWWFLKERDSLWVKTLKAKYLTPSRINSFSSTNRSSSIWKGLATGWDC
ncbi:hypothetical protein CFOL_v3_08229, partial [Cephalotus follicularis]